MSRPATRPMNPARFLAPLLIAGCAAAPLRAEPPARVAIWKVSDADSTVYLAGSVHLLRPTDLPVPLAFDEVYAEAEELVFEIDMNEMSTPGAAEKMRRLTTLPEGEMLSDHFTGATIKRLRRYLETSGKPVNLFDFSKPTSVLLLMSALEAERHGARPDLGLEATYHKRSLADQKPSQGLETIEFQIGLLDAFEPHEIEKMLNEELDRFDVSEDNFDQIVTSWRAGDGEALAALLEKEQNFTPELRDILLTKRNANWVPKIEVALAQAHDFLFLVGTAHLVGEGSVVTMLEEKGYQVVQMESTGDPPAAGGAPDSSGSGEGEGKPPVKSESNDNE